MSGPSPYEIPEEIKGAFQIEQASKAAAKASLKMTLEDIIDQCRTDSGQWFPDTASDLAFQVLALIGETGEVANLVKKVERGSHDFSDVEEDLKEEVVDVFIYLMNIVGEIDHRIGFDIVEAYKAKREKNAKRFGKPNEG